jgi:hypothetical protein
MQLIGLLLMAAGIVVLAMYRPRTKAALSETRAIALLGGALLLVVLGLYLSMTPGT